MTLVEDADDSGPDQDLAQALAQQGAKESMASSIAC